jgi:hypothetical protein
VTPTETTTDDGARFRPTEAIDGDTDGDSKSEVGTDLTIES